MRVMRREPYVEGTHFSSSDATAPQDMFNDTVSDKSTKTGDMTVVMTPGNISCVGFAGLEGNDLIVVGRIGDPATTEVFRYELSLSAEIINSWYGYFFDPFDQIADVFIDGIPPFLDLELTITIEGTSTACGVCAFGRTYEFGRAERGASVEILDYSTKETDETTGVTTFDEGPFSKRVSASLFVDVGDLNRFQRVLREMRATPTFYALSDGAVFDDAVTVFGFYRDVSTVIAYPRHMLCAIELEGLT